MKKSYLYIVLVLLLTIYACGGGGDEGDFQEPETQNTAPTTPTIIFPLNNTVCIDNNVLFEWNASTDAEGNSITYRLELAENNAFSPILITQTSLSWSKLISLKITIIFIIY